MDGRRATATLWIKGRIQEQTMALSTKIGARTAPKATVSAKQTVRASNSTWIAAFASDESATQMMASVEGHPLFERLSGMGLVKKSEFAGHIPADKARRLSQMQLDEANALLQSYGLDDHPDLAAAVYGGNATARKRLLAHAEGWGLERAQVERALLAFCEASADRTKYGNASLDDENAPQVAASQSWGADAPWDITEVLGQFCRAFDVSDSDFWRFFLDEEADDIPDSEIADELACPVRIVGEMRSQMIEWRNRALGESVESAQTSAPAEDGRAHVADVRQTDEGWVVEMSGRYRNRLFRVEAGAEDHVAPTERAQWRQLESQMRALNERSNRRAQAIRFMCRRQHAFLVSGDAADLAPLTQGEIAAQIGVKPDRISRLLFDDDRKDESKMHRRKSDEYQTPGPLLFVRTPRDPVLLRDLLCELAPVVSQIKARHPDFSDAQISRHLREQWGIVRTRAAVQAARKRGA